MTVSTRTKTSTSLLRRRRGASPVDLSPAAPAAPATSGDRAEPPVAALDTRARNRAAERPQDEAVYNCSCGFVFSAAVSASVGCPHCGDAQAW